MADYWVNAILSSYPIDFLRKSLQKTHFETSLIKIIYRCIGNISINNYIIFCTLFSKKCIGMWLLTFLVVLFVIVIAMIMYANWPSSSSASSGGCPCGQGCSCNSCGQQVNRCGCPVKPKCNKGCQFC